MSLHEPDTANERFKRRAENHIWWGLIAAVGVHFAVLAFFPEFATPEDWSVQPVHDTHVVTPQVPLPEPPTDIARPATPTVSVADLDPTVTMATMGESWDAAPELPPPPTTTADSDGTGAVWLGPSMTRPHLKNGDEVQRTLEREYPVILRDAGIGGVTVLVLLVDVVGDVAEARVEGGSGHAALDRAAVRVAMTMDFTPALNQDRAQAVWVRIPVSFEVRRFESLDELAVF